MSDDAESHELLAVVAALHHQAIIYESTTIARCRSEGKNLVNMVPYEILSGEEGGVQPHLSTNRSTMGICAFLNCFFA